MEPVIVSRRLPENINRIVAQFPEEVQEFFLEMISADRSKQTIANYAYDFSLFFDFLKSRKVVAGITCRVLISRVLGLSPLNPRTQRK